MTRENRTVVTFWRGKTAVAALVPREGAVWLIMQYSNEIAALDDIAALLDDLAAVAGALAAEAEKMPQRALGR